MASDFIERVVKTLENNVAARSSELLGEQDAAAAKALRLIGPSIFAGLVKDGSSTEGAGRVLELIRSTPFSTGLGDDLLGVIKRRQARSGSQLRDSLCERLFQEHLAPLVQAVSDATGVRAASAEHLLEISIVVSFSVLRARALDAGSSPVHLARILGRQRNDVAERLDARLARAIGYELPPSRQADIDEAARPAPIVEHRPRAAPPRDAHTNAGTTPQPGHERREFQMPNISGMLRPQRPAGAESPATMATPDLPSMPPGDDAPLTFELAAIEDSSNIDATGNGAPDPQVSDDSPKPSSRKRAPRKGPSQRDDTYGWESVSVEDARLPVRPASSARGKTPVKPSIIELFQQRLGTAGLPIAPQFLSAARRDELAKNASPNAVAGAAESMPTVAARNTARRPLDADAKSKKSDTSGKRRTTSSKRPAPKNETQTNGIPATSDVISMAPTPLSESAIQASADARSVPTNDGDASSRGPLTADADAAAYAAAVDPATDATVTAYATTLAAVIPSETDGVTASEDLPDAWSTRAAIEPTLSALAHSTESPEPPNGPVVAFGPAVAFGPDALASIVDAPQVHPAAPSAVEAVRDLDLDRLDGTEHTPSPMPTVDAESAPMSDTAQSGVDSPLRSPFADAAVVLDTRSATSVWPFSFSAPDAVVSAPLASVLSTATSDWPFNPLTVGGYDTLAMDHGRDPAPVLLGEAFPIEPPPDWTWRDPGGSTLHTDQTGYSPFIGQYASHTPLAPTVEAQSLRIPIPRETLVWKSGGSTLSTVVPFHAPKPLGGNAISRWWLAPTLVIAIVIALFIFDYRAAVEKRGPAGSTTPSRIGADARPGTVPTLGPRKTVGLPGGKEVEVRTNGAIANLVDYLAEPNASPGRTFVLDEVDFEKDTSTLTPPSEEQIRHLAQIIQAFPGVKVRIESHVDATTSGATARAITAEQATTLKAALILLGIEDDRVEARGMAAERPVAIGKGPEDKGRNRRVELIVTSR